MTKKYQDVKEIRFLPMSKKIFDTYEKVINFLIIELRDRGGIYYYIRHNLSCKKDSLILFQYNGKLIASSVLIDQNECKKIDENGDEYNGYYQFDMHTMQIFNNPITSEEFRNIDSNFHGFNQSTMKIELKYLQVINSLIKEKTQVKNEYETPVEKMM